MTASTTTGRKRGKRSLLLRRLALLSFAPSPSGSSSWPAGFSQDASDFDSLRSPFGLPAAVYLRLRCDSQDILPEIELVLVGMVAFGLGPEEPVLKPSDDLIFPEKFLLQEFQRFERDRQFTFEFLNPFRQLLKIFGASVRHPRTTLTNA